MHLHQIARLAPILRLVREVPSAEVLDVGSGDSPVAAHLGSSWRVTAVEYELPVPLRDRLRGMCVAVVEADARKLPFADRTFDVSVALDLLEHIPAEGRNDVLRELLRVTRHRIIVAGPMGEAARKADETMIAAFSKRGALPVWLREHRDFGVPALEDVTDVLDGSGRLRVLPNNNAWMQTVMMRSLTSRAGWHLQALLGRLCGPALRDGGPFRAIAARLLWVARGFDRRPIYRPIVVVDRP